MITLFKTCLILLLLASANSQSNEFSDHLTNGKLNKSHTFGFSELKSNTEISVNKKPAIQKEGFTVDFITAYSVMNGVTRFEYTYDDSWMVLSETRKLQEGQNWVNNQKFSYNYDNQRNLKSKLFQTWNGNDWDNVNRINLTYAENGSLLTNLTEDMIEGQWQNSIMITYTYDKNWYNTTMTKQIWSNGDWVNFNRETYEYNDAGLVVNTLKESWLGGKWNNSFRIQNSYDNNGNLISYSTEHWIDVNWFLNLNRQYNYNQKNLLTSAIFETWNNGKMLSKFQYTLTYDGNDNEIGELKQEWAANDWLNLYQHLFTYDTNEKITLDLGQNWINSQWADDKKDNYSYDSNEYLQVYTNQIKTSGIWVNNIKYTFEIDIFGFLKSQSNEKWDVDKYVPLDTLIEFTDDLGYYYNFPKNNKIEVNWKQPKPQVPFLIYPKNSETKIPIDPVLRWYEANNASNYHIQLSEDSTFKNDVNDKYQLADTTLIITGLINYNIYYWRIKAINNTDSSDWSPVRYFRTIRIAPTVAPTLLNPVNNATDLALVELFTWNEIPDAETYQLQISTSENFESNNIAFNDSSIIGTSGHSEGLTTLTNYYWRVRALNEGGYGPWSEVRKFKTTNIISVEDFNIMKLNLTASPNPFSVFTTVSYSLAQVSHIRIDIYNSLGSKITTIINEFQDTGDHQYIFDGSNYPSGVYYYTIHIGERVESGQLVLVK